MTSLKKFELFKVFKLGLVSIFVYILLNINNHYQNNRTPVAVLADKNNQSQSTAGNDSVLPPCFLVPPNLKGAYGLLATFMHGPNFTEIAKENPNLRPGGLYSPPNCTARHRVAIVIPYRNREEHLRIFLHNIHPMLARQKLEYGVYVVDQALPGKFNRGMLLNIGFVEAMKRKDYQCVIFHDVDLIPEDDRNIYSCPDMPRHLSAAIDKFKYKLPYRSIFGGASAIRKEHMILINGYSNIFFGWGAEDDDIFNRILGRGLNITRYSMEISRYRMIKHIRDKHNETNKKRFHHLRHTRKRMPYDGINNLYYTLIKVEELPSHTRFEVLIDENEVLNKTKQDF